MAGKGNLKEVYRWTGSYLPTFIGWVAVMDNGFIISLRYDGSVDVQREDGFDSGGVWESIWTASPGDDGALW